MNCRIEDVTISPTGSRKMIVRNLLQVDGFDRDLWEDPDSCYCALPLTAIPEWVRGALTHEHAAIKRCIAAAGLKPYDSMDSEKNPWVSKAGLPGDIYDDDTLQLAVPRFFEFTDVSASTGCGMQLQKAIGYNKMAVVIAKKGLYVSRMSTGARRCILVEYGDIETDGKAITDVFATLREYEPGVGKCSVHGSVLIGFSGGSSQPVCLKGLIEEKFPKLRYDHSQYAGK